MHSWFNSKEDSLPTPPPLFLSGHIIYLYDIGFLCGVYRSGQHKESRSPAADHPLHVPLHPGLHPRHSRHLLPTLQVVHQGYHTHTCWKPKTGSWFKEINELVYLLLTYVLYVTFSRYETAVKLTFSGFKLCIVNITFIFLRCRSFYCGRRKYIPRRKYILF